jgi:hypothetical protein
MRLTFHHNLGDILELNRSIREQRLKAWLVTVLGLVALVVAAWLAAFRKNQPDATPVFVSAAVLLLLGAFTTRLAGLGAWLLKARRTPYALEVTPEGLAFVDEHDEALLQWPRFSRWYQTPNLLVLVAAGDALAVPKRSCSEAEWTELLALVQRCVGSPSRW